MLLLGNSGQWRKEEERHVVAVTTSHNKKPTLRSLTSFSGYEPRETQKEMRGAQVIAIIEKRAFGVQEADIVQRGGEESSENGAPSSHRNTLQQELSSSVNSGRRFEAVATFRLIWWNQGSGSRKRLSIWRPIVPQGMWSSLTGTKKVDFTDLTYEIYITGQEREEVDGAKHMAVTVEMADVTSNYGCAIIDEIQACNLFIA
nr:uncharacterized protein LOC109152925 [Ipomoea trifida]